MMPSRRRKLTIIALVLYWPAVFIGAHIPIPALVRAAGVSDKSLHFAAYLILTFLLWFAISPDSRVDWRRATVWWAFLGVVAYGVMDELLQALVGRSCDIMDFAADLAGALTGLIMFTFLAFWPSFLFVTAVTIFLVTNLARANVGEMLPVASAAYYLLAYGLLALLWIQQLRLYSTLKAPQIKWLVVALAVPGVFLLIVKLASVMLEKSFTWRGVIFSMAGIAAAVVAFLAAGLLRRIREKPSA